MKTIKFPSLISLLIISSMLLNLPTSQVQASTNTSPDSGTMWAWGYNVFGQLGDGTKTTQASPVTLTYPSGVSSIGGGYWHSLALRFDGSVWAWGFNRNGQLGDGTTIEKDYPIQVADLTDVVAISAGAYHNLALKADGSVWAWGWNGGGQLGDGTTNDRLTPVLVANLSNVTAISAGYEHSLALKSDGSVWAWGYNLEGQLGNGNNANSLIPVQVIGLNNVKEVSAGWFHSLALKTDNSIWSWGMNSHGELGIDTADNDPHPFPQQVSLISEGSHICGGPYHSLALTNAGSLWVWGNNAQGQLGDGSTTNHPSPQLVPGLSNIINMAGGWGHSLAVTGDGAVYSWGLNDKNQLGLGTGQLSVLDNTSLSQSSGLPESNLPMPLPETEIDGNPRKADGSEWQWGENLIPAGLLPLIQSQSAVNPEVQSQSSAFYVPNPTLIPGFIDVSVVAAGYYHSLAIIPKLRPPWDVNGDHIVNVGDLVLIGSHWNETGTPGWIPEDVNSDSHINVGDLVIVGAHWNESW